MHRDGNHGNPEGMEATVVGFQWGWKHGNKCRRTPTGLNKIVWDSRENVALFDFRGCTYGNKNLFSNC